MCAQAGPRVGALCTRLSFDSGHCFESLFGTLFMNTVHEHCSRSFKNNNNTIKENKILNEIKIFFVAYDLIYGIIVSHYL